MRPEFELSVSRSCRGVDGITGKSEVSAGFRVSAESGLKKATARPQELELTLLLWRLYPGVRKSRGSRLGVSVGAECEETYLYARH